jgi:VWFA-related protein
MRTPTAIASLVLLGFTAAAQSPRNTPRQTPAQTPDEASVGAMPKFSSTTNLVIVDVTVKDKSGKPIDNLKQRDFTVTEDGKPQKVAVFEFQKLTDMPEPPQLVSLADQIKLPEAPKTTITAETPGQVQYHNKRLLVLFFDFSSMGIPEQLRAQEAATDYLNTKITKDDIVAIMLYASRINVLTDFTSDRDQLAGIIKGLPIGEMSEMADLADDASDDNEDTGAAFVADETEFNIFNTDRKLQALEQASRMLAALPEKKSLIYFAGGLSKTGVDNQAQLDASVNAAVKANVAIFPIDTRGLMADPPGGGASKGASRGSGAFTGSVYNSQRARINGSQETLVTLAADTGGKAFLDSNDITAGITEAQQDLKSYYVLGYYSQNGAMDGKFRKISVKLNNKLEAKLEHRPGYWAGKIWTKMSGQDREQQLTEAISAGEPLTDIPLALQVDYFRIGSTSYFVPVSIKVPGSAVELAAKGGGAFTNFDFLGQIQDEQRAVAGNVRDNVRIKLDQTKAANASRKGFQYDAGFTLGPGRYRMKFLVRENVSGKMGTFEAKFTIPDLSADTSGLKLSSIIWSSQREPVKAAVAAAERLSKKEVAANPLVVGDEKMVPNITRVFRRNQNLYVNFDVYDSRPDPDNAKARKVKVSMSLFNLKGKKEFEVGPLSASDLADTRPEAVPVHFQIPLKDLAPGRYTAQINAVDEVGRKFAFPRAPIVIR